MPRISPQGGEASVLIMLSYHVRTAWISLARNAGINLLTIFSLAVGLSLVALTVLSVFGLHTAVKQWTSGFGMVAYLAEGLPAEAQDTLRERLAREPGIRSVDLVSSEEALRELKEVLGEEMLQGLEANPLPASFRLSLSTGNLDAGRVEELADRLSGMDGIVEVEYGRKWVERMAVAARQFGLAGSALGLSLGIGIIFILPNTIKILFYRRSQEIDILKLLGATQGFIRAPFLLEGVFFGVLSGGVAALGTYLTRNWVSGKFGLVLETPWPLQFTEPLIILLGAVLGLTGSFIALGRIRL